MKYFSLLILITSFSFSQGYQEKVETRLHELYGDSVKFSFKKIKLMKSEQKKAEKAVRQHFFRPELYTWKMELNGNVKFAVLDNVVGKVQPITFLMIFTESFKIEHVEVIKYRESHGYEVRNESFLNQYMGKSKQSNFSIGEGVDGISGATISVNSLSRGIHKLSLIISSLSEQFK